MIEKRINQNFQNLFEKYGYSKDAVQKKSLFEELNECDQPVKKTTESLNENAKETTIDLIKQMAKDDFSAGHPVEDFKEFQKVLEDENIKATDELYSLYQDTFNSVKNESLIEENELSTSVNETLAQGTVTTYEEKIIDKLLAYMGENFGVDQKQMVAICKEVGMKPEDILGLVGQEEENQ